jgi:hypothetical protein
MRSVPSELLDGMTAGYFSREAKMDCWLTYDDGKPIAVAYCAPEPMTQGTWNLLLIAVHPDSQSKGYNEEARIREFYQAGEDKIVFRKAIKPPL